MIVKATTYNKSGKVIDTFTISCNEDEMLLYVEEHLRKVIINNDDDEYLATEVVEYDSNNTYVDSETYKIHLDSKLSVIFENL